tara:strand:+ start:393 stop:509 length:117 start_codon:yes stop_codon:yes gene_type:complete
MNWRLINGRRMKAVSNENFLLLMERNMTPLLPMALVRE